MTTSIQDAKDKIRRSINQEFVRMEDDFDDTRAKRATIIDKLVDATQKIDLINDKGELSGDIKAAATIFSTALKALSDAETAQTRAIALKLKQQEQQLASAESAKDRIALVLKLTAPGAITSSPSTQELEDALEDMFGSDIQDFELKSNPRDLED